MQQFVKDRINEYSIELASDKVRLRLSQLLQFNQPLSSEDDGEQREEDSCEQTNTNIRQDHPSCCY